MRQLRILLSALLLSTVVMASAAPPDPTVYALAKGKSYHVKNCRMKQGSTGMKLSVAKSKGYKACKVCKPPK